LEGPPVDYVVIDLGDGRRWLTSRLYIFGQLVRRMRGVRAFVFVRSVNPERVVLGSASVEQSLWLLARRFPYLEATFADVYGHWWSPALDMPTPRRGEPQTHAILSSTGSLPSQAAAQIATEFVRRLQASPPPLHEEWLELGGDDATSPVVWEHAQWITVSVIEQVLGDALNTSRVDRTRTGGEGDLVRSVIAQQGEFVSIVDADGRFERLIDRMKLVEAVARGCSND
jgi:hypothetical protein